MITANHTQLRSTLRGITIRNTLSWNAMRTISLRLDADADALLRMLCERLHATQTDVIRQAIESLAAEGARTPGMLGAELGLPGFFTGDGSGSAVGHSAAVKARLADRRRDERQPAGVTSTDLSGP